MPESSSAFTIAEQTGRKRVLILKERALPYRPFTLSGSMRAETTWYPGNPIASMQVLGNEEAPTTITGRWADRFLRSIDDEGRAVQASAIALLGTGGAGATQPVANVVELAKTVDSIRREGQVVEVTWDQQIRHGIVEQFVQIWDRAEILNWEITFKWISQGEREVPISFALEVDQKSLSAKFNTLYDQLHTSLAAPFSLVEDIQRALDEMDAIISDAIGSITDTTANITDAVLTPATAVKRTLAAMETIKEGALRIENIVSSKAARALINTDEIDALSQGQTLTAESYVRGVKISARLLKTTAAEQNDTLTRRDDEQEILAVFTAHTNMDLRDVSTRFYGTQEEWRRLLKYNGLTSSKLLAGMFIMVPRLINSGV
jgi:hypothetical protein